VKLRDLDRAARERLHQRRADRQRRRVILAVVDADAASVPISAYIDQGIMTKAQTRAAYVGETCGAIRAGTSGRIGCQLQINTIPKQPGDTGNQNHWEPHYWADGESSQYWNDDESGQA
jgi:hypothetical protein